MKIKYWFTIFPSVFIWKERDKCLFYDSKNCNSLLYPIDSSDLELFIKKLQDINNLYCIKITEAQLSNEKFKKVINKLYTLGFGKLVKQDDNCESKPISLPPILNLQTEVSRLTENRLTDLTVGEHVLRNLHEIHIKLPNKIDSRFMDLLVSFFDSLTDSFVNKITIVDSNLELICHKPLCELLSQLNIRKTFIFSLSGMSAYLIDKIEQLQITNFTISILVFPNFEIQYLKNVNHLLSSLSISNEWSFQVSNPQNFDESENAMAYINSENINTKPFFDGVNINFFEKYIFLEENELKKSSLNKREVFAHQALNTNDFGKLTITSDGKVYANPHFPALGTIEDDIRELIYKEMTEGKSWLRIRDMEPCCDCVYQWLCPSPSNYELAIGKPNLCHVKP